MWTRRGRGPSCGRERCGIGRCLVVDEEGEAQAGGLAVDVEGE